MLALGPPTPVGAAAAAASPNHQTIFEIIRFVGILLGREVNFEANGLRMLTSDEENAEKKAIENAAPFKCALDFYRKNYTCPCAFPRFIQIVSFDSRKLGLPFPMACFDTEILIGLSISEGTAFYKKAREWLNEK